MQGITDRSLSLFNSSLIRTSNQEEKHISTKTITLAIGRGCSKTRAQIVVRDKGCKENTVKPNLLCPI